MKKVNIFKRSIGLDYLEVVIAIGEEERVVSESLSIDAANLTIDALKEALKFVQDKTNFQVT